MQRLIVKPVLFFFSLCLCVSVVQSPVRAWTTYRGNVQRTGNTDGKDGPQQPKVLWVMPSAEHFITAPVPDGDRLYISGLGAFNVSTFYAIDTDPKKEKRAAWTKSTPMLKLPTVSSPAVIDGRLIFGDGMHQTDGAALHCLRADTGLPLWQLPQPGQLIHLEGAPTVIDRKAYIGGGNAGALCVDIDRVTLEGKERSVKEIQGILDEKWKELLKKYEEDKKKDPDFAVKPTEDKLPKPAPVLLWQQGKDKWHVDAPVTVVGDKVLVCSAFLDKEKQGERAVFCLDAKDGKQLWKAPLSINPWGGASVQGKTVVVTCSTVSFDPGHLKGAKGAVVGLNLDDGKQLWSKEVTGGAVSCAALTDTVAVVTATDGKVRAFNLADGERKWIFDAKAPLFAPPALVKDTAYVGDLAGVLRALNVSNGQEKWKLDLGADPAVKAPGMIYGGPAVQNGRIYVATCNVEGANANKPTVVVCIGEK